MIGCAGAWPRSLAVTKSASEKVASERLGHSKITITLDLYSHVLPNMQAEAATVVDAARRAALKKRTPKGGNRLVLPNLEDRET